MCLQIGKQRSQIKRARLINCYVSAYLAEIKIMMKPWIQRTGTNFNFVARILCISLCRPASVLGDENRPSNWMAIFC